MKKLIFLFIISLLLSCSGSRKLTNTSSASGQLQAKTETAERATLTDKNKTKRDSTGSRTESSADTAQSDVSIKITEYDPSRPADPGTGRPPVVRETEITSRRSSGHRSNIDQNSKVSENANNNIKTDSQKSGKEAIKAKSADTAKSVEQTRSGVRWWTWAVGATLVLVLCFLFYRFRS